MLYTEEQINQVKEASDIVSVIGQFVKLEKKGANYFGLCPFHGEKTASFSVSPRKQICYCFGCQKGGDVIHFIMEYEQLSYPEAIRYLADRAHIVLPEQKESGEEKKKRALRDRLYEINKEAAYFYHDRLMMPDGKDGLSYFSGKRKLSKNTIIHFGLGYSGKTPGELYRHLKDKGYTDTELKESGLVTITEQGAKDKFWNRVMFPIMDINNKVIGFGGRVMGDGLPKYLNSPETMIFDKSGVLYGLNFAKRSHEKCILLCEGYMDVISLHQAGFTNAVASLGTALTDRHAKLLKRFTDTVILTQDSDKAGIAAKIRSFPILHDAGLNVKALEMTSYKDPDEFIKANGPDAYRELIEKSRNAFLFIIDKIKEDYDLSDPAQVTAFYRDIAEKLCMFREPVERNNYLTAVCREQMINAEELRSLVEKVSANRTYTGSEASPERIPGKIRPTVPGTDKRTSASQEIVLFWMSSNEKLRKLIFSVISPFDFTEGIYRDLAQKLSVTEGRFDVSSYMSSISENAEALRTASAIFLGDSFGWMNRDEDIPTDQLSRMINDSVKNIKDHSLAVQMTDPSVDIRMYQGLMRERTALRSLQLEITDELLSED